MQVAGYVVVEFFGFGIVNVKTFTGFDPQFITGAFADAYNVIVVKRGGVGCRMLENPEFITIVPVETRQCAKPHKARYILKNTSDIVMRQPAVYIKMRKLELVALRLDSDG